MIQFVQSAHASGVSISWLRNSENDVAGYKVYYGTAHRNYQHYIDVGPFTTGVIDSLSEGVTYYFAVTAYDNLGNESAYSQEVHAAIPAQGTGTPSGGSNVLPGGGTGGQGDGTKDGGSGVSPNEGTGSNETPAEETLIEIIGDVDEPIDLRGVNPTGQYSIVSIMTSSPTAEDNFLHIGEPGVYLYNVYDINGIVVYKIRVSVASKLITTGSFQPGTTLDLEALSSGIAIQLKPDAYFTKVPIGIGNPSSYFASAEIFNGGTGIEFDMLPYGLKLAEPASITVKFDKSDPIVQRFDENENAWKDISDVTALNGQVTFSTQELGKFRVYSEATDPPAASSGVGGGFCFISTGIPVNPISQIIILLIVAVVLSIIHDRKRMSA
jgi:hypothetical protein